MLIVDAVRNVLSSGNRKIDLNSLKIDFTKQYAEPEDISQEEANLDEFVRKSIVARFGQVQGLDSKGNPTNE